MLKFSGICARSEWKVVVMGAVGRGGLDFVGHHVLGAVRNLAVGDAHVVDDELALHLAPHHPYQGVVAHTVARVDAVRGDAVHGYPPWVIVVYHRRIGC